MSSVTTCEASTRPAGTTVCQVPWRGGGAVSPGLALGLLAKTPTLRPRREARTSSALALGAARGRQGGRDPRTSQG
eukprot:2067811-Alexandrium_andersonii.AAC.1